MEETLIYAIIIPFILFLCTRLIMQTKHKNLPPSPPALPIIGHNYLLKQPIHRSFHNLLQKYGQIMTLRFGNRLAVVVSSPSLAEEVLIKNDVIFANRPDYSITKYTNCNISTIGTTNYGDHWRNLLRISTVEILSSQRMIEFQSIRQDEVCLLVRRLHEITRNGFEKVILKPLFRNLATYVVMRMVAGKRYYGENLKESDEARKFQEIMEEYLKCTEMTNPADLIPLLKWLDFGYTKKFVKLGKKIDSFLQGLVDEHRMDTERNTMVTHLLAMQKLHPQYYSDEIIKGLILSMVKAGAESTSTVLEWALTNLYKNPTALKKLKAEMDTKIGQDRLIDESDLPKLSYLRCAIYETQRLFPAVPLLPPHLSSQDCTIGGHHIPANTMLFVNTWTIHRDPK